MHQRIGILGGTFNPVHYGHLAAAEEIRERLKLDHVLFIPASVPPHKQEEQVPAAFQRMEMIRLAIAGNDKFFVSDIEVKRGGKSYTVDTIEALRSSYPEAELFFMTGIDSFLEITTWHHWQQLLAICIFVVLSRPGYRFSDLRKIEFMKQFEEQLILLDRGEASEAKVRTPAFTLYFEKISHYDISSTDIRKKIREGLSVKYLLPEPVERYIINNKLYD